MGHPERWADLREFIAARGLALSRTAFLLTGDEAAADDLLQDTYVDVVRRWWRIDRTNPEPYVRRIMYSRFVDGYRRRRIRDWAFTTANVETLPLAATAGPESHVVDRLTLHDALQRITPPPYFQYESGTEAREPVNSISTSAQRR